MDKNKDVRTRLGVNWNGNLDAQPEADQTKVLFGSPSVPTTELDPQRANKRTHLCEADHVQTQLLYRCTWLVVLVHRQCPRTSYWVITCHGRPAVKLAADSSNFEVRHSDSEMRGLSQSWEILYGNYHTRPQPVGT
jgi:hypothetical protein